MLFGAEMFGIDMTGTTLLWVVIWCVVALLVELILFKGACALADVTDPSWLFSFLIVLVFFVGRGLLAWFFFEQFKGSLDGIGLYSLSFVTSGVVFWAVCALGYALVLSTSLKKSLYTASAQVVLDALVGSLALGITLFVLSIRQIGTPVNKSEVAPPAGAPVVAVRHAP
jgi:hypothetical protein